MHNVLAGFGFMLIRQSQKTSYNSIKQLNSPGGMASAKEAAANGAKVLLLDFVKPSNQGTKWGLGGTCVNVGCVPKKLMHYAGHMGSLFKLDSGPYGWELGQIKHDWDKLVNTVQSHIHSLNFSYTVGLRSSKVKYINVDVTGKYILIATGCRPNIPEDVEGAKELSITSDDIFSLKKAPGKTLVVGASYVALECAGFLNSLGYDVSVAVRSIVLRGFDQQCANKVKTFMIEQGVLFLDGILPKKLTKETNGQIKVLFSNGNTEIYDTVLYATDVCISFHIYTNVYFHNCYLFTYVSRLLFLNSFHTHKLTHIGTYIRTLFFFKSLVIH
uniref:FAD/NAD(P)-binding domain-containing protein n=1 Tax=Piliocolobus tephrosceles TaxID=591936 RepID=A0A8C9GJJ7_9PRIM